MRTRFFTLLIILLVGTQSAFAFCPFCPPAAPTLSEQAAASDAVALVSFVASTAASTAENNAPSSTFKVVEILKNFEGRLEKDAEIKIPEKLAGRAGDLFLLMGKAEGRDAKNITWDTPSAISEIGFQYLKQAPAPETPKHQRLKYFLKFLEYSDPLLADDAYYEFAAADYEDVVLIKDELQPERIKKWINDPDTLAPRLGLYGLMLGLSGDDDDAELLKEKILDEADKTRLGIDGIMGGYLLLTEEEGMQLIEETKIKNPEAPVADVHAAMSAFRFLWDYGEGVIPRSRLIEATRLLIDRPDVANLAIADLARWKDWSVMDKLMEVYKKGDPTNPLGNIAIRRAVIRYMIAATLDQPETADPENPPAHVAKAQKHLENLRLLDPKAVSQAERLMLPSKD